VVASRLRAPSVFTVTGIGRDALEPSASLPDALRAVTTLHVDQPGAPAGFGSLYLRGADPNHTIFLLDGVKLNDLTNTRGGGFDVGALDPRTLERVDILPGAASAIYGADAMAGVVDLRTSAPRGTGVGASAGLGGSGYRRLGAAYDARTARIGVAALEDGGAGDLGFKRIRSASLRFPGASLMAWQHDSRAFPEDSGGPRYAVRRELEQRETTTLLASGAHSFGALKVQLGALSQDGEASSPGVAPGVRDPAGIPRSVSSSKFTRASGTVSAQLGPTIVGAEYQREEGDTQSAFFFGPARVPSDFSLERNTRSLFAEARHDVGSRWQAQAGVRLDSIDRFGTQASLRGGLRHTLAGGSSVVASIGTGFKPPSFLALGNPLVGNPDLRPEESVSAELGFTSGAHRFAIFRSQYRDLIDFDAGPPPRLVNRDRVTIDGVEYAASAKVRSIDLGAAITAIDFRLPEGEGPLRNRPRSKASAHAGVPVADGWSARLVATRVGQTFDSSIPTGAQYLAPYALLDAAIVYARAGLRATLALDNALDRRYEQFIGFAAMGRRLRAEVAVNL
jgi:vitamin B12 transporter